MIHVNTGETVDPNEGHLQGPMMMMYYELLGVINSTLSTLSFKRRSLVDLSFLLEKQQTNSSQCQLVTSSRKEDKAVPSPTGEVLS